MGPEALHGRGSTLAGMALCLAACASFGCAAFRGRRLRATPPLLSAACQLLAATVALAVITGAIDRPWRPAVPSPATLAALAGIATLSTALAYVIFFRILATSGPTNVVLVTLLIPVSGIAMGALVLRESLEARQIAGALVIASGLLVIVGRLTRALRDRLSRDGAVGPPKPGPGKA